MSNIELAKSHGALPRNSFGAVDTTDFLFTQAALDAFVEAVRADERARGVPAMPVAQFEDSRVQLVYEILISDERPPENEHWEGFVARRIVDALAQPAALPAYDVEAAINRLHAANLQGQLFTQARKELLAAAGSKT